MNTYTFTEIPDRANCGSEKWNLAPNASTEFVPLSVADMEFYTPVPIKEALHDLVENQILGYTGMTDAYADAVCSWMKRRHGFAIEKDWIVTTPGVVNALALLIETVTEPGDEILVLPPVYYPFYMSINAKGRNICRSALICKDGQYEIDFEDLAQKAAKPTVKALIFCNPHNPIGRVWTKEELTKLAKICIANDVFMIDDEIHNDLIMAGYQHTVMATISEEVKENTVVCTAPSKTFNLAGVQCSNIIIPNAEIRARMEAVYDRSMQQSLNVFAYTACMAAYNECEEWLEQLLPVIADNAAYVEAFLAEHLPAAKVSPLQGTYLLWVDFRGTGYDYKQQKERLEQAGVYLDNGEIFGEEGKGFQRINLACARATIEKTMWRIIEALGN